jgi:hypothetical protein
MNPAFHVVNVALQAVSSFYAKAESLQSFLPIRTWGHNSDGPAEEKKMYQLIQLICNIYSLTKTNTFIIIVSGWILCVGHAVGMENIKSAYEMLARKPRCRW